MCEKKQIESESPNISILRTIKFPSFLSIACFSGAMWKWPAAEVSEEKRPLQGRIRTLSELMGFFLLQVFAQQTRETQVKGRWGSSLLTIKERRIKWSNGGTSEKGFLRVSRSITRCFFFTSRTSHEFYSMQVVLSKFSSTWALWKRFAMSWFCETFWEGRTVHKSKTSPLIFYFRVSALCFSSERSGRGKTNFISSFHSECLWIFFYLFIIFLLQHSMQKL